MSTLAALVWLAGCGEDADESPSTGYVGQMSDSDAYVAALVTDFGAVVYVCNGAEELALWFEGPVADPGEIELETPDGASLRASLSSGSVSGTVELANGDVHTFTAEPATGDAGLYRALSDEATSAEIHAGWVLRDDGTERGALRRRRTFEQAPAFDPSGLRVDGMVVPIYRFVVPAKPPAPPAPLVPVPYPNVELAR